MHWVWIIPSALAGLVLVAVVAVATAVATEARRLLDELRRLQELRPAVAALGEAGDEVRRHAAALRRRT